MRVVRFEKNINVTVFLALFLAVLLVPKPSYAQHELWSTELIYSNISYGSVGQTDYSVDQLTVGNTTNMNPTISNSGDMAWQGRLGVEDDTDYEIFFRPAGSSVATQLTDNSFEDNSPRLNDLGDVVWQGFDTDYEIFLHSGGETSQLTDNDRPDIYPMISNNGDVCWMGRDAVGNDWEIFLRSGETTPQQITKNLWKDLYPEINSLGEVVWKGSPDNSPSGYEIFTYSAGDLEPTRITTDDLEDFGPRINDNSDIVWETYDGSDWEIVIKYSNSSEPLQLTNNDTEDWYPKINIDGVIVWQGYDGNDWEIYYFSPTTPGSVFQITDNTFDDTYPRINANGDIAWLGFGEGEGMYLFDADSKQFGKISDAVSTTYHVSLPTINDQGKVTWYGWDGDSFEIFLATSPDRVHDDVYFFPQTLNLQSRGQGFTMYVNFKGEEPEVLVDQIDTSTIGINLVNNISIATISPLPNSDFEIVDFDNDGVLDLKVKFDRQEVIAAIKATMTDPTESTTVALSIEGQFVGFQEGDMGFTGTEMIQVSNRKESKVKKAKTKTVKISKAKKGNKGKQLGRKKK